jgi:hypothetical protein
MKPLILSRCLLLACAMLLIGSIAPFMPAAGAAPVFRTCGLLPGEGFYSYTKSSGITCRAADRIAYRVVRKFCRHHSDCRYGRNTSPLLVRRGRVGYRGWSCQVRQGYELSDVRCRRGRQWFHHESAA